MKVLVFLNRVPNNPYFKDFLLGLNLAGIRDVRLSRALTFRSNFDAIHFHFPEHVITQGGMLRSIILTISVICVMTYSKLTRRPMVWMVHNVSPHWPRRKFVLSLFMDLFTRWTSGYVFLSYISRQEFYEKNPLEICKPSIVVYHSRYKTKFYSQDEKTKLRQKHGLAKTAILLSFLGDIKRYKGLEQLSLVPSKTSDGRDVVLAVCGEVDESFANRDIKKLFSERQASNYIRVSSRLTDNEIALWIQSSDAVLLPYLLGSNSGMAINVLSNRGRIISSDIPMFSEIRSQFGPSWVKLVDVRSKRSVVEVINEIPAWIQQPQDLERLEGGLKEGDPEQIGRRLLDFYNKLRAL